MKTVSLDRSDSLQDVVEHTHHQGFFPNLWNLNFNTVRLWVYFIGIFITFLTFIYYSSTKEIFKTIFFKVSCPFNFTVFMFVFVPQLCRFCFQHSSLRMTKIERQSPPDSYILKTDGRIPWTKRRLCSWIPGHKETGSVSVVRLQTTVDTIQILSLLLPMNVFSIEKSSKLTKQ